MHVFVPDVTVPIDEDGDDEWLHRGDLTQASNLPGS
jgi:hypothetical protein